MTTSIKISDVIVVHSYRQDLGEIGPLAESIKQFGLLSPILITPDNCLIAGRRRLEACKLLEWETISVQVFEGV